MFMKIFIRTFPSAEECELFESILQTKWPDLLNSAQGVRFRALSNNQAPHVSIVVWEFPNEKSQRLVEKKIDENISRFVKTLSPKTMSASGEVTMDFGELYAVKA